MTTTHSESGRSYRGFAAASVTLAPLCLLVLPGLFSRGLPDSPREALAESTAMPSLAVHSLLFLQLLGAALFVAAISGIVDVLTRRGRGGWLRATGAGLGLVGALSAMTLIGMEFAQQRVLRTGSDQSMVDVALAIQEGAVFGVLLLATFAGLFIGMLLRIVGLWRARVIPVWTLACLVLPLVVGVMPLPGGLGEALGLGVLLVPFAWTSWAMLHLEMEEGPEALLPAAPLLGPAT